MFTLTSYWPHPLYTLDRLPIGPAPSYMRTAGHSPGSISIKTISIK